MQKMKYLLKKSNNNDLQAELQRLIRLLTTALEEGRPLMKVEVKIEGLSADALEVFKRLADIEGLLRQALNQFTPSPDAASVVPQAESSPSLPPEDIQEKQGEGFFSLDAAHLVQIWRSRSQQEGASLEDAIKKSFPHLSMEPVNLRDRNERWRLIAIYHESHPTSEIEGLILPRRWENWFFELYNKWFDCDGAGRRKGIIFDIVRPAMGRRVSEAWEPIQKGQVVVKGPTE